MQCDIHNIQRQHMLLYVAILNFYVYKFLELRLSVMQEVLQDIMIMWTLKRKQKIKQSHIQYIA